MRWITGIIVVLVAIAGYLFWDNMTMPDTTGLVNGRLQPCPKSPNCVCCCHNDTAHYIAPLPLTSGNTLDQIQAYLSSHYNAEVVQKTPDYMHVVVTTPTMHYKDDLEFSVNREKGTIRVRSASRIGYSDGGVNRERIEAIRAYLESQQTTSQ